MEINITNNEVVSNNTYNGCEVNNRKINKKEIIRDMLYKSLIGNEIVVVGSSNKSYIGISGEIVDETEKLFIIKTERGVKKLLKKAIVFEINYINIKKSNKYSKTLKINGELLNTNLISRIKKIKKF